MSDVKSNLIELISQFNDMETSVDVSDDGKISFFVDGLSYNVTMKDGILTLLNTDCGKSCQINYANLNKQSLEREFIYELEHLWHDTLAVTNLLPEGYKTDPNFKKNKIRKRKEFNIANYKTEELPKDMVLFRGYVLDKAGEVNSSDVKKAIKTKGDKRDGGEYKAIYATLDPLVAKGYATSEISTGFAKVKVGDVNYRELLTVFRPKNVVASTDLQNFVLDSDPYWKQKFDPTLDREVVTTSFDLEDEGNELSGYFTIKGTKGNLEYKWHNNAKGKSQFPLLKNGKKYSEKEFNEFVLPYMEKVNAPACNEYIDSCKGKNIALGQPRERRGMVEKQGEFHDDYKQHLVDVSTMEFKLDPLVAIKEDLSESLTEQTKILNTQKQKLNAKINTINSFVTEGNGKIADKQNGINVLKNELKELKNVLKGIKDKEYKKIKEAEIKLTEAEIKMKETALKEYKSFIDKSVKISNDLQKKVKSLDDNFNKFQSTINDYKNSIESLEQKRITDKKKQSESASYTKKLQEQTLKLTKDNGKIITSAKI